MRTHYLRLLAIVVASAALTACTHFELIRSSQGPSPSMDHCSVCMDLGQAWAFFRMGSYDQAAEYCTRVIEEEAHQDGLHTRRAGDIRLLSNGYLALRSGDYPAALAMFREIGDPQLRELGQPSIGFEGRYLARAGRERPESLPETEATRAGWVRSDSATACLLESGR